MEELWKQLESMQAAEQQLLAQVGNLYIELEEIEKHREQLRKTIEGMRSQLSILSQTSGSLKNSLISSLGLEDGDYTIDFANRKIVPNGQAPDSGNGQPEREVSDGQVSNIGDS